MDTWAAEIQHIIYVYNYYIFSYIICCKSAVQLSIFYIPIIYYYFIYYIFLKLLVYYIIVLLVYKRRKGGAPPTRVGGAPPEEEEKDEIFLKSYVNTPDSQKYHFASFKLPKITF